MSDDKPKASALVLTGKGEGGTDLALDYGADAGIGMQHASEGGRLPFLAIAQPLSKGLIKGHEKFIPGLAVGDMYIPSTGEILPGEKGFFFVPVTETHDIVEWLPDQKGFVRDRKLDDPVWLQAKANAKKQYEYLTPEGNVLQDTYRMYGAMFRSIEDVGDPEKGVPLVISFDRGKLKVRDSLMNRIRGFKGSLPLYAVPIHVTAFLDHSKKKDKDFHNYKIKFAVDDDLAKSLIRPTDANWTAWSAKCRELVKNVESGKVAGDTSSLQGDDAPAGGKGDDETRVGF